MSTAAVMMVKDEADVIGHTIEHLLYHVDHVYVIDNASTDGTSEILHGIGASTVTVIDEPDPAYMQSERTTQLALRAYADGHTWAVPCDADEIWNPSHEPDRRIADYLDGLSPDVLVCEALLFDHFPTGADPVDAPSPFHAHPWRNAQHGGLPKVAVRLNEQVTIHAGNHGADHGSMTGARAGGLMVHHFSWRSPEQYLRKITNGRAAYAAAGDRLDENLGVHWRMWDGHTDESIVDHFWTWFYKPDVATSDPPLFHDPAPVKP